VMQVLVVVNILTSATMNKKSKKGYQVTSDMDRPNRLQLGLSMKMLVTLRYILSIIF
jgi:hypothetical protein